MRRTKFFVRECVYLVNKDGNLREHTIVSVRFYNDKADENGDAYSGVAYVFEDNPGKAYREKDIRKKYALSDMSFPELMVSLSTPQKCIGHQPPPNQ